MNKEFVLYNEALVLKELGFDEPCFANFFNYVGSKPQLSLPNSSVFGDNYLFKNSVDNTQNENLNAVTNKNCSAPLYQQIFRWFEEKYGLFSNILDYPSCSLRCFFSINKYEHNIFKQEIYNCISHDKTKLYNTRREAELACLKELIKIVKI